MNCSPSHFPDGQSLAYGPQHFVLLGHRRIPPLHQHRRRLGHGRFDQLRPLGVPAFVHCNEYMSDCLATWKISTDFATILPGSATLTVYFRPSVASKTAVGFEVSTSLFAGWSEPRLRFCEIVSRAQISWHRKGPAPWVPWQLWV